MQTVSFYCQYPICLFQAYIQGAAERTPRFGRGVARGGVGAEQWGVCC
jgi:hypothetical protein